jgi:hypothetical protein
MELPAQTFHIRAALATWIFHDFATPGRKEAP